MTIAAPDGGTYAASDPDLLRWVHIAEAWCFLHGYQRYGRRRLSAAEADRYFREVAAVAQRLGAKNVPTSQADVDNYFGAVLSTLDATPAALDSIRALKEQQFPSHAVNLGYPLAMRAAIDLLPSWARSLLGLRKPAAVVGCGTAGLVTAMRFARGVPPAVRAAQIRCQ